MLLATVLSSHPIIIHIGARITRFRYIHPMRWNKNRKLWRIDINYLTRELSYEYLKLGMKRRNFAVCFCSYLNVLPAHNLCMDMVFNYNWLLLISVPF